MNPETILWIALMVTVSLAVGWVLGNLYAISYMRSKRRWRLNKGADRGEHLPEFLRRKERISPLKEPGPEIEIATEGDPRRI